MTARARDMLLLVAIAACGGLTGFAIADARGVARLSAIGGSVTAAQVTQCVKADRAAREVRP